MDENNIAKDVLTSLRMFDRGTQLTIIIDGRNKEYGRVRVKHEYKFKSIIQFRDWLKEKLATV